MVVKPVGDRLLIKPMIRESSVTFVVAGDPMSERPCYAEVVDSGESKFEKGQIIAYNLHTPHVLKIEDKEVILIEASDVLAIITL